MQMKFERSLIGINQLVMLKCAQLEDYSNPPLAQSKTTFICHSIIIQARLSSIVRTISSPIDLYELVTLNFLASTIVGLPFHHQQLIHILFFNRINTYTQMVSKVCLTDPSKLRLNWHLQYLKDILQRTSFPKLIIYNHSELQ